MTEPGGEDAVRTGGQGTAAKPSGGDRWRDLLALIIPALVVLLLILGLISKQAQAESAAADLANLLPIGFALAAGMVASVNPCGFLLLPSYISYHLGTEQRGYAQSSPGRRLLQALLLGAMATIGFLVVMGAVGLIVSAGGQWLIRLFPLAGLVIGAIMTMLGLWLLLTGAEIGVLAASRIRITPQRNLGNVFLFGIVYALGSLSCTLPIFLVVVGSALATRGLAASLAQFLSYALGMGVVLTGVTVGSALFRGTVARWLKGALPYLDRASALFLIGAGGYLIYYWVFFAEAFS